MSAKRAKNKRKINIAIKSSYIFIFVVLLILSFIKPDVFGRLLGKALLFGTAFYFIWTFSGGDNFFREPWKRKI